MERASADEATDERQRHSALDRAQAAEERATVARERAEALVAEHREDAEMHGELAEAAAERSRADEQRALAAEEPLDAARHQAALARLQHEEGAVAQTAERQQEAADRELRRSRGALLGPGRFRAALREAVEEGRARRLSRDTFAPATAVSGR